MGNNIWPVIVRGIVVKGDGIAGTLFGTPTANMVLQNPPDLAAGVYAGSATVDDDTYVAAVYFVDPKKKFEVHLLDFTGDLLGKTFDVRIDQHISEHVAWESEEQMRDKIADDIRRIRAVR